MAEKNKSAPILCCELNDCPLGAEEEPQTAQKLFKRSWGY